MPCITEISGSDEAHHFETLLCKACKYLTVEQIKSLTNHNSGICYGIDWYANHLWLDCTHNDRDTLSFYDEEKREIDLKELRRIGYEIKDLGNGSSQLIEATIIPIVYPY